VDGESEDPEQEWFSELKSIASGTCIITMRLRSNPAVTKDIEVTVN